MSVSDRTATGFRCAIGVIRLHAALHLIPGITTAHRTGYRGNLFAVAAANLVSEQPTDHRTHGRTGNTIAVLYSPLVTDRHVLAYLTRRLDGLLDGING